MPYIGFHSAPGGFTPRYSNVLLLLLGEEANGSTAYVDSSGYSPTSSGTLFDGCAVSTAQAKFGTGSIYFDGTNDWIGINANVGNSDWEMQAKWCIEGYFYSGSTPTEGTGATNMQAFYVRRVDDTTRTFIGYSYWSGLQTAPGLWLRIDTGGSSLDLTADVTFSTSAWQKWAVEYDGTDYMIRVDDVEIASTTSSVKHSNINLTSVHIGYGWASHFYLHGYLDNYTISVNPL